MRTLGLTTDPLVREYLAREQGLSLVDDHAGDVDDLSGIPLFSNGEDRFLGGYKSFYAVVVEATPHDIDARIERIRSTHRDFQCLISVPYADRRAALVNYILDLGALPISDERESRFELYAKKTRNLVRKSYKNSFSLVAGKPPAGFYDLYADSMRRLGGMTKSKDWFNKLEQTLSKQAIVLSLYDGDKLIAANYCIHARDYVFLMFNVSEPSYWKHAVNDRLYDELVAWAIDNKVRYIDFGPSVKGDDPHNHFKEGFGAKRWHIINRRYGSGLYRLRAFFREKRHNLKLRFR